MEQNNNISTAIKDLIEKIQRDELNAYYIYRNIANHTKDKNNSNIIRNISEDEKRHCDIWKKYTGKDVHPDKFIIFIYTVLNRILGFTFVLKLMERRESVSAVHYNIISKEIPEALKLLKEEELHENELISLLDEERLRYVGSIVLGLNDALVEITGTLAGLALAIQNTRIIALLGLVTGISATISMAASDYLSSKSEKRDDALKSAAYTGISYIITVILLVTPFLLLNVSQYILAMVVMLLTTLLIIAAFNYYLSIAQDIPFKKRFLEMTSISIGVSLISFIIGLIIKNFLGITI